MGVLPFLTEDASSAALAFHERPIDLVHLARTTLGDPSLEGEMLEAFGSRASMLILRMQQAARSSICAAAQALKGSARGIGAWRIASAAEAVELAARLGLGQGGDDVAADLPRYRRRDQPRDEQ